jgi:hypothetical protein
MQKLEKVLPYSLLISYLTLCHFRSPEISDSIIIIALAGLSGFRAYINNKELPNYEKIFAEKINEINKELALKERKLTDLQNSVGMHNIAKQRKSNVEEMVW